MSSYFSRIRNAAEWKNSRNILFPQYIQWFKFKKSIDKSYLDDFPVYFLFDAFYFQSFNLKM